MDFNESTAVSHKQFYTPFQTNSVSLICAPTNSGKTHFMIDVLKRREVFFKRDFDTIVVVLCNRNVSGKVYKFDSSLNVFVYSIEDFDVAEHLVPNCVLIFEDVQRASQKLMECVNVQAHHSNLESVFIIVQRVIGADDLFKLCSLVHNLIIFYSSGNGLKTGKHILQFFFQNCGLKDYLRKITDWAEIHKEILLLAINQLNGRNKTKFVAISGIDKMGTEKSPPSVIFPNYSDRGSYESEFGDLETVADDFDAESLPPDGYILVKAENVRKRKKDSENADEPSEKKRRWNETSELIDDDIRGSSGSKASKIIDKRNVAKSIMGCVALSITRNGKMMMIKDLPGSKVAIMDYINQATRKAAPSEKKSDELDILFTKELLKCWTPKSFIKNKNLLKNTIAYRPKKGKNSRSRKSTHSKKKKGRKRSRSPSLESVSGDSGDREDDGAPLIN